MHAAKPVLMAIQLSVSSAMPGWRGEEHARRTRPAGTITRLHKLTWLAQQGEAGSVLGPQSSLRAFGNFLSLPEPHHSLRIVSLIRVIALVSISGNVTEKGMGSYLACSLIASPKKLSIKHPNAHGALPNPGR